MSTITATKTQLATMLTTALVGTGLPANKIYPYRTMPMLTQVYVMITYTGGIPEPFTADGDQPFYEFALVLIAKHEATEATLEAAEDTLNEIENIIYDTLSGTKNAYWRKLIFNRPSARPPAPKEMAKVRYGEMYIRTYL